MNFLCLGKVVITVKNLAEVMAATRNLSQVSGLCASMAVSDRNTLGTDHSDSFTPPQSQAITLPSVLPLESKQGLTKTGGLHITIHQNPSAVVFASTKPDSSGVVVV